MWSLKKIGGQKSSKVTSTAGKVQFGFPNVKLTIQPGKTAVLSTGYALQSLPPNTVMHTVANPQLITKGLLAFPKIAQTTGQITHTILNLSKKPFTLTPQLSGTPTAIFYSENLEQIQNLTDFGSVLGSIVGGIGSFFANLF